MSLRASLHLLALVALLAAFGGGPARSQPTRHPSPTANGSQAQSAGSTRAPASGASQPRIAATGPLTNTTYLPALLMLRAPLVDLSIDGIEITQSVQTPSNSVPLVAARPTIVRVYAKYTGSVMPGDVTV